MNSVSVAVMQPIEHRSGDDPAFQFVCQLGSRLAESGWDVLINPLMRSRLIVVGDKLIEDPTQLLLVEDQEVVKAFPAQRADETFAERIGSGGLRGCVLVFDA